MKYARIRTLAAVLAGLAIGAQACAEELVVAVQSTFTTLDPYDASDTLSQAVAKSFYEGLYGFDRNMKRIPVLAESAEPSADGLVYTIKLKQGVKFHDGTEFTAEAVKANFDRVTDPKNGLKRYSLYSNIAKTEALDPYTVRFTLKRPFSAFLNQLAHPSGVMICPSAIEKWGGKVAFHPCGTGPYTLKDYNPSEILHVVKNPNYRVAGLPKLDSIHWVPVIENATRAAMLRTGEAQYVTPMPLEQIAQLKDDKSLEIQSMPSLMSRYLSINNRVKPFNDKRVREAINYAINKEALAKVAYAGYAVPMSGIIPPKLPTSLKMGPWPYDPKKARELLKEAGYPNGFETTLWSAYTNTTASKAVQFIQQQLRQVGIKVTTRLLEPGVRTSEVYAVQNPDDAKSRLYYVGWADSTMDPDLTIRPVLDSREAPPKFMNTSYYANPKLDDVLDRAQVETDAEKRQALYNEAQRIAWSDAPWAFLLYEENTAGASVKLKNFTLRPDGGFDFYNAYWEE